MKPLRNQPFPKEFVMAFVITEPCFGCKYTKCIQDCPVECFREGDEMLFIDPDLCIDCGACISLCPVEAIYHEDDVPEEWREYIELNAEMSKVCPAITEMKTPLVEERGEP
jgi:ferredoxin